jgi:glycosyltransferase involved in cell wall biosynthesis
VKLLFLVTEDWYFLSHRMQLARAARDAGASVLVMTHITRFLPELQREGFTVIPWRITRGSLGLFRELGAFLQVVRAYKRERPDLLHHVALKPIVYGGLAARLSSVNASVNAITGMGHVFTNSDIRTRLLRWGLLKLLRISLGGKDSIAIFQNEENRALLVKEGVVSAERTRVIRGTGIDIDRYAPQEEPDGYPITVLASRLVWDKGVGEFVEAARILRARGTIARFVLVGKPDPENPASIPEAQIRDWVKAGIVEWWGFHDEIAPVFAKANIVCLPSYGEGFPRVLVEAASCGRAIVATDVPGCREIVRHGENGLLVPSRSPESLARALDTLIFDSKLRHCMAKRGREIAVCEYSEPKVLAEIMFVYRDLLGFRWGTDCLLTRTQNEVASESSRT